MPPEPGRPPLSGLRPHFPPFLFFFSLLLFLFFSFSFLFLFFLFFFSSSLGEHEITAFFSNGLRRPGAARVRVHRLPGL